MPSAFLLRRVLRLGCGVVTDEGVAAFLAGCFFLPFHYSSLWRAAVLFRLAFWRRPWAAASAWLHSWASGGILGCALLLLGRFLPLCRLFAALRFGWLRCLFPVGSRLRLLRGRRLFSVPFFAATGLCRPFSFGDGRSGGFFPAHHPFNLCCDLGGSFGVAAFTEILLKRPRPSFYRGDSADAGTLFFFSHLFPPISIRVLFFGSCMMEDRPFRSDGLLSDLSTKILQLAQIFQSVLLYCIKCILSRGSRGRFSRSFGARRAARRRLALEQGKARPGFGLQPKCPAGVCSPLRRLAAVL